jgi:hypothetical protein
VIATLALVLSLVAVLLTIYQLSLRLIRKAGTEKEPNRISYIDANVLSDQRSFFQSALRTMTLFLESGSDETLDSGKKVVRLLTSTPLLAASPVISDNELSRFESETEAHIIWIVTSNESIEFSYPSPGGEFSAVILQNVQRGIEYRYLVADSPRVQERRRSIVEDFRGIQIRLFDDAYWRGADRAADEYVLYSSSKAEKSAQVVGYYLYPRSNPRRWIRMDDESAYARLHDTEAQWALSS